VPDPSTLGYLPANDPIQPLDRLLAALAIDVDRARLTKDQADLLRDVIRDERLAKQNEWKTAIAVEREFPVVRADTASFPIIVAMTEQPGLENGPPINRLLAAVDLDRRENRLHADAAARIRETVEVGRAAGMKPQEIGQLVAGGFPASRGASEALALAKQLAGGDMEAGAPFSQERREIYRLQQEIHEDLSRSPTAADRKAGETLNAWTVSKLADGTPPASIAAGVVIGLHDVAGDSAAYDRAAPLAALVARQIVENVNNRSFAAPAAARLEAGRSAEPGQSFVAGARVGATMVNRPRNSDALPDLTPRNKQGRTLRKIEGQLPAPQARTR
jgi:hypothetical protein